MTGRDSLLFVGNGPYLNRGCEAIVRGTMVILRHTLPQLPQVYAGVMGPPVLVAEQAAAETDAAIKTFAVTPYGPRGSAKWFAAQANRRCGAHFQPHTWDLRPYISKARAAIELGGDNYSLDYGRPTRFVAMDRRLQRSGMPVFIWGASVGPLSTDPAYELEIMAHLKTITGIFVRESETAAYLAANGVVANVHLTADPAFLMEPVQPPALPADCEPQPKTIGVNLSPLVGQFRKPGLSPSSRPWLDECVALVGGLLEYGWPILLVPHVESTVPTACDFAFLRAVAQGVNTATGVSLAVLPESLSAAQIKWVISKCDLFVGARTHATIAAFSTGVPTLSIGYSLKARGINRDLFGHLDYCLPVAELSKHTLLTRVGQVIDQAHDIRAVLADRNPELRSLAMNAGCVLRDNM